MEMRNQHGQNTAGLRNLNQLIPLGAGAAMIRLQAADRA